MSARVTGPLWAVVAAAALAIGGPACAQRVIVEPSISARLTASDNSGLGFVTAARDVVSDVIARIRVRAEGSRLSLVGDAALESVVYARHTQDDDVLPRVDLTGRWLAVERLLFVEAAVRTEQTKIDPFGPRLTSTSTNNTATATLYRLSPTIESDPAPNLHLRARSDNIKSKAYGLGSVTGDTAGDSYFGLHTASLTMDPRPLGWRVEAESTRTRYQGEVLPLSSDVARVLLNMAIGDTATVGVRGGTERNNFLADTGWRSVYGGQATWRPSERTLFELDAEHRFFGNALHLAFTHRMPWLAWDLHARRDIDTTPRALFSLAPTDNVAGLLDAILTTRFPNAADRATQVQNIISRQGLPPSTSFAISILGPRLSVTNSASVGVAYLGVRNTLALSVFAARSRDALEDGALATDDPTTNNTQYGAALAYTLRLTPSTSAGLTLAWSRIQSLDSAVLFERTQDASVRGHVVVQLAPKTFGTVGAEYRKLASSVTSGGREALAFVGWTTVSERSAPWLPISGWLRRPASMRPGRDRWRCRV